MSLTHDDWPRDTRSLASGSSPRSEHSHQLRQLDHSRVAADEAIFGQLDHSRVTADEAMFRQLDHSRVTADEALIRQLEHSRLMVAALIASSARSFEADGRPLSLFRPLDHIRE